MRLHSCSREEVVGHNHKTFPKWFGSIVSLSLWLCLPHFHLELEVTGKRVNREGGYRVEISAKLCFYGPERLMQWLETRLTKIGRQLKESVNYYLKRSFMWKNGFVVPNDGAVRCAEVFSKRRCHSGPQKSVRYTEVSAIMCPLDRVFSMRIWPSFHLFPRMFSCPL